MLWLWLALWGMQEQEDPHPPQLPEVVVTASPLEPPTLFDAPYKADVLTLDDLQRRRLSRTLPEALKETVGISLQKTGHGQGSPFIRGMTGYRNLLLVDGIRLNTSIQRQGPNQYWGTVDGYLIDRLEVVRGPVSVLYGSDSMGGTVVAYTREPREFDDGFHGHVRTLARYSTGEASIVGRQEAWGNHGPIALLAGATRRSFGDIRGGRHIGRQPATGYNEWDADAKLVYRIDDDRRIVAAFQRTALFDAPRTHRTTKARPWHGTVAGTDRRLDFDNERALYYLQYRSGSIEASASLQRQFERETRITPGATQERRELTVWTSGLWLRAKGETKIGTLTYGGEWYRDRIDSGGFDLTAAGARTTYDRGVISDNTTYDLLGAYLQDEVAAGPVDFTLGGRVNHARVNARQVDFLTNDAFILPALRRNWTSVVGSARAVWHVADHWNVVGGVSQGFRAPSVHDLTAIAFKMSGTLELPSPNLKPERSTTFELGARAEYERWGGELFGFYTDMDGVIERELGPNPFFPTFGIATANRRLNLGDANFYGADLAAHVDLGAGVTLFGDIAYVFGETERMVGGRRRMKYADKVNPATAHIGLRWESSNGRWWAETLATMVGRQRRLSPSDKTDTQRIPPRGTPGFSLFTLRAGYRLADRLSATFALENVANRDYRWHGSGSNEPGTNAILGVEWMY